MANLSCTVALCKQYLFHGTEYCSSYNLPPMDKWIVIWWFKRVLKYTAMLIGWYWYDQETMNMYWRVTVIKLIILTGFVT